MRVYLYMLVCISNVCVFVCTCVYAKVKEHVCILYVRVIHFGLLTWWARDRQQPTVPERLISG